MPQQDIVVIGAGIVGLAVARELLTRWPSLSVTIVDKEDTLAAHQTGHNSGVMHSGVYYEPGSLKARLCVEGKRRLVEYCDERGIRYDLCGKVIVATEESELPRLDRLHERGKANGVPGLEMIGPERLKELEPYTEGVKALHSPQTGIIDYTLVARAYADDIRAAGGEIRLGHKVTGIKTGQTIIVQTDQGDIQTRFLIACAGLHADKVARMTGSDPYPIIVPFRGDYQVLKREYRYLVKSLIYPVPDPSFPFLGVHLTIRPDGEVWLGPNAVLAFAREGYTLGAVRPGEALNAVFNRGFLTMASKYWSTGMGEMYRDINRKAFIDALKRYCPTLTADMALPGPSGVRAQALDKNGKLVDDFVFSGRDNVIHVRNAPSPAATSSLAIGTEIVQRAEREYNLPIPGASISC